MAKAAEKAAPKKAAAAKAEAPKAEAPKTAAKKPAAKKETKKAETVIKTVVQVNGLEFDVTSIAEKALKEYKSVHKRKVVNEFVVYVKPEENAAYYTVNGEGDESFKLPL